MSYWFQKNHPHFWILWFFNVKYKLCVFLCVCLSTIYFMYQFFFFLNWIFFIIFVIFSHNTLNYAISHVHHEIDTYMDLKRFQIKIRKHRYNPKFSLSRHYSHNSRSYLKYLQNSCNKVKLSFNSLLRLRLIISFEGILSFRLHLWNLGQILCRKLP